MRTLKWWSHDGGGGGRVAGTLVLVDIEKTKKYKFMSKFVILFSGKIVIKKDEVFRV